VCELRGATSLRTRVNQFLGDTRYKATTTVLALVARLVYVLVLEAAL
jgi:hypothetical protein